MSEWSMYDILSEGKHNNNYANLGNKKKTILLLYAP